MHITPKVKRLAAISAVFLTSAMALQAKPLLKSGDRMVFFGDSITQQRCYSRYVMDFFALRYPNMKVTFRNTGWDCDDATKGIGRAERDVLTQKPTVVSICLGMNDGNYRAFNDADYTKYISLMTKLVRKFKESGVQVVLLTPGCVDPDSPNWFDRVSYNGTLSRFAQGIQLMAQRENVPCFDINTLMLDVQKKAKVDDPKFTMLPDAVHPNPIGHAVMAYGLLKALGCDDQPSSLQIDAATRKVQRDRCQVKNLRINADSISFSRTDEALPVCFDSQVESLFKYYPFTQDFNQYLFKVSGLKEGSWKLMVDGTDVGQFSAQELANGVNLYSYPGPWHKLSADVDAISKEQETLYFKHWRGLVDDPLKDSPELRTILAKPVADIQAKEIARAAAVSHRTWEWMLMQVK